jgi:hypothetical protein
MKKEGRKNYRRPKNELKRATDKVIVLRACLKRTEPYDLMYMKTKELG